MAKKTNNELLLPDEILINKIYLIRNQKVMLDRYLAELFGNIKFNNKYPPSIAGRYVSSKLEPPS